MGDHIQNIVHDEIYNILPVSNVLADHPAMQFTAVRVAIETLKFAERLPVLPYGHSELSTDLLDWLGALFGFQKDNVRNQREHLILLLANRQMQLQLSLDMTDEPHSLKQLDPSMVRSLRKKILENYSSWCSYLGRKSCVKFKVTKRSTTLLERDLLYTSLYLLIWGEAANLRFMPECLCYIFHHMGIELNKILENVRDPVNSVPAYFGENAFLQHVVTPIYNTIKSEAEASRAGKAPHSAWRNYDDLNEFFWSRKCFEQLGWPLKLGSKFFVTARRPQKIQGWDFQRFRRALKKQKVLKRGFVEQRSFWNIFRSFDRLWLMHILFLQASIIVACQGAGNPFIELRYRDTQVQVLSIFITWGGIRFLQSLLDAGTQYSLTSKENPLIGIRMVLKSLVALTWTVVFAVFYSSMWAQRNHDLRWSDEANRRLEIYLKICLVFILPEILALILFIFPWVRNFIEKRNWRIFYLLTWWFQSRLFIGRGLRESLFYSVAYTLFWVALLLAKFSFSYFFQIKPMISPSRAIVKIENIPYMWHALFKHSNYIALVLLWAPVMLIYFMDIQIWYSIFSSLVGAMVGLLSHIGEIRDMQQFRLRFQFFASAIQFNLIPEEFLFKVSHGIQAKIRDGIRRLQLRYGFGRFKKIESSQVESGRFAIIWNEIVKTFREEDIVSDQEVELLRIPSRSWNVRVIHWPCILLCNELLLALTQAQELEDNDRKLWLKISKNEYRRCAVIEVYDSFKYLLKGIVMEGTEESMVISNLFQEIDGSLQAGKFTETYKTSELSEIHSQLTSLVNVLLNWPNNQNQQRVVHVLQNLYDIVVRDFPRERRSIEQLRKDRVAVTRNSDKLLFEDALCLPDPQDHLLFQQLKRLHTILTTRDSMLHIPKNLEARRRIAFFSNSLFMNMPRALPVEKMVPFSVLTPYYDEDVLYSKDQLRKENEDGVSIVFYLRNIFPDDWSNFIERMHREGMEDPSELWSTRLQDLRLWASYRGQTLARTVRGMMYYHKALKMLAFLDRASELDIRNCLLAIASKALVPLDGQSQDPIPPVGQQMSAEITSPLALDDSKDDAYACVKFTYVVTCQIYGAQKAKNENHAKDILLLMKTHPLLRIAYVDEARNGNEESEFYSVLVKYDQRLHREVEIYRVKLPGPIKLGEGKPENQNHALIFTRGDALQAVDMNQENYFEETLKMRNLLQEFSQYYGLHKPTILGIRENVFTGSVSSLAWFMSAQEACFVTIGQRVLARPLKIRMHYGHPDVFDRLWVLGRGGISKASKVINISEDIFAGFNCTLRRGNVTHHEYIQIGKGRDVGLNQISLFEAKVASGNGEQVLSRDVYRLGHRLDFFRMLSLYYSTVGFYFNTLLIIVTVYVFLWGRIYMVLSGVEKAFLNVANVTNNKALGAIMNQQFLVQLGLFTALPLIIENAIERGFLRALWDFFTMQIQLASVFYTFSMGTRTHFFGRTVLHGGAKYRATGRGFVVQHKSFAENYRLYSRSHFVKAIELGVLLIVYASYSKLSTNLFVYIIMSLSCWFLAISWAMAPFIFNPLGFDWLKTVYDFDDFVNWIWNKNTIFAKADKSWEVWWYEEQEHLQSTGIWGKALEILLDLRFFILQYGIVYQLGIAKNSKSILVYLISWVYVVVALAIYLAITYAQEKYAAKQHIYYRGIQSIVILLTLIVIVILLVSTDFKILDIIKSILALMPTGWGLISIALVLRPLLEPTMVWHMVVVLARFYEMIFGMIIMVPVALLSWIPGFQTLQTRILFNEAFSRGLRISQILVVKKKSID
eukprot:TRINITY_DN2391_c0_g1_i1.p1 TRINITY_DN2391_c0_g1~~TRINITY_DN2391_c0_g1_i1.p1  ORF type:complete len:1782 (+),score=270.87 TRINITY_DN2391_c0_g1_i1:159-5504(+)